MRNNNALLIDEVSKKISGMYGDEFMIVYDSQGNIQIQEYDPEYDDEELPLDSGGFWIENRYVHVPPELLGLTQAQINLLKRKAQ